MKNDIFISIVSLIVVFTGVTYTSLAQSGSLDQSFNTDGIVTTSLGSIDDYANSVAIQNDGKIIVAGESKISQLYFDFGIVRYNINGSLDNTFNSDGRVTTHIGVDSHAKSIALQNDGKIIVVGWSTDTITTDYSTNITLVRYNIDGSLDNSFDNDGIVTTSLGSFTSDRAYSVAIQNDGKILVAGNITYSGNNGKDFVLLRYNTDGSLDNSLNSVGFVITPISFESTAYSIAIQNDGKILVAGTTELLLYSFTVVRYNTDGSLDNSFDNDGIVNTTIGSINNAYSLAIQSDGKIVVAGDTKLSNQIIFALVRYNPDGSLDNSFDVDGKVTTPFVTNPTSPTLSTAYSVAIQNDGKIVAVGCTNTTTTNDFALVRYMPDGSLDNSFNSDGIVTTHILGSEIGYSIAIQNDGKIVVVGKTSNGIEYDFALVRYNNIISGLNDNIISNSELGIYPNPFSIKTDLQTSKSFKIESLILYNCFGQIVIEIQNINDYLISLNRNNLKSGIYFLQLTGNERNLIFDKLVITD